MEEDVDGFKAYRLADILDMAELGRTEKKHIALLHIAPINDHCCPVCRPVVLQRKTRQHIASHGEHKFAFELSGNWCPKCEELWLSGFDARLMRLTLMRWYTRIDSGEIL